MSVPPADPKRLAVDANVTHDLRHQIKKDPQVGLQKVAQEFESLFLNMMLKSMRETVPQDGLLSSDHTRFYTGMLDQQLAQDMASHNTLGLARLIEAQLRRGMSLGTDPTGVGKNGGPASESSGLSPNARDLLRQLEQLQEKAQSKLQESAVLGTSSLPQRPSSPSSENLDLRRDTTGWVNPSGQLGGRGPSALGTSTPNEFVAKVWPYAVEASRTTGVPPQFLVAQAALETGWGRHEMLTAEGSPSHNLFGIKAGRNWRGKTLQAETSEFVAGAEVRETANFRAYDSYAEGFSDYANLLRNSPRYAIVIGSQDGAEFARRLQQAGYASDPQYAEKLSKIIHGPTLRQALLG